MALQFGVFDHIEPVPGMDLEQIYAHRLIQIEQLDKAGFYAYHLAEHHTPAVHSLAPSQNVFLAGVSQRTTACGRVSWKRGVDGFRIDVAHGLVKDRELRDDTLPLDAGSDPHAPRAWVDGGVLELADVDEEHVLERPERVRVVAGGLRRDP